MRFTARTRFQVSRSFPQAAELGNAGIRHQRSDTSEARARHGHHALDVRFLATSQPIPAPPISLAILLAASASASMQATRQPLEARCRAMPAPMPWAAPVTITLRDAVFCMSGFAGCCEIVDVGVVGEETGISQGIVGHPLKRGDDRPAVATMLPPVPQASRTDPTGACPPEASAAHTRRPRCEGIGLERAVNCGEQHHAARL